jgi:heme oxygenase
VAPVRPPKQGQDFRMQKDNRRWQLRERTTEAHQALDSLIGAFESEDAYRAYPHPAWLHSGSASSRWFAVDRLPPALAGYQPSLIGAELLRDLDDLGLQHPQPAATSGIGGSGDDMFGVLYVLEGSALGARLLVKSAEKLGFDSSRGARHLVRQSAELDNWRDYLKRLDEAGELDIERAADAASRTFDAAQGGVQDRHARLKSGLQAQIALFVLQKHDLRRVGVDEAVDVGGAGVALRDELALRGLHHVDGRLRRSAADDQEIHARCLFVEAAEIGIAADRLLGRQHGVRAVERRGLRAARRQTGKRESCCSNDHGTLLGFCARVSQPSHAGQHGKSRARGSRSSATCRQVIAGWGLQG